MRDNFSHCSFCNKMFVSFNRIMSKIKSLLSEMIFLEYLGLIFFLGCSAFNVVKQVVCFVGFSLFYVIFTINVIFLLQDPEMPLNTQRAIKFFFIGLAGIFSLLFYSYFGTMITEEVSALNQKL